MTSDQKSFFSEKGYLLLKGAVNKRQLEPTKDNILNELKRLKIWSSGKTLSASIKKTPAFQQITKLSGLIKQNDLHSKMINQDILSAIDALAQISLFPAQNQFLISLPNQGDWTINGLNWHTDISSSVSRPISGIQAFILIDDVQPRGGATLALAGSHLLTREKNSNVRQVLKQQGDIERELRADNLSIIEMSGHAGDVYLMDMSLLHTPSINSTNKLRLMATVRYLPRT